jgi:hypothetical protein
LVQQTNAQSLTGARVTPDATDLRFSKASCVQTSGTA